jgi:hypothetical protein
VVWDINADGRAEILLKTNKSGHPRYYDGERLTILNGKTGKVIREARWPPADGLGDYYNSDSRNYLAVAHLDGRNPYIIATRGLYKTQRIWAYDANLELVWERIIGRDLTRKRDFFFKVKRKLGLVDISQGSHTLPIVDLDGDGKEEILWGEHCLGEHGQDLPLTCCPPARVWRCTTLARATSAEMTIVSACCWPTIGGEPSGHTGDIPMSMEAGWHESFLATKGCNATASTYKEKRLTKMA